MRQAGDPPPYQRNALDRQSAKVLAHVREGAAVKVSKIPPKDSPAELVVCPGRTDRVPSETCAPAALRKHSACPMCGERVHHRWPLPCDTCTAYAQAGYHKAEVDAGRGDLRVAYVQTVVDGLRSGFHDKRLSQVFRDLFDAFGVEEEKDDVAGVVVGWEEGRWSTPDGLRVRLDAKQIDALRGLFRWLNVGAAEALADSYRRGSELLTALISGKLTMDGLNDKVAEQVARYQATADKIRQEETGERKGT